MIFSRHAISRNEKKGKMATTNRPGFTLHSKPNKSKKHSEKSQVTLNTVLKKQPASLYSVPVAAEPPHSAHPAQAHSINDTASTVHSEQCSEATSDKRMNASDTKSTTEVNSSLSSRASSFEWGASLVSASELHQEPVSGF